MYSQIYKNPLPLATFCKLLRSVRTPKLKKTTFSTVRPFFVEKLQISTRENISKTATAYIARNIYSYDDSHYPTQAITRLAETSLSSFAAFVLLPVFATPQPQEIF